MKKKETRHCRYVLFDLNGTNNKNETSSVFFSFVDYYSVFFCLDKVFLFPKQTLKIKQRSSQNEKKKRTKKSIWIYEEEEEEITGYVRCCRWLVGRYWILFVFRLTTGRKRYDNENKQQ